MIGSLFETMQRHHLPVESVLQDALKPTLFKKWKNFRINKLHQKVLRICLPIFERKLNFEMVFTYICQTNLFEKSYIIALTKQATKSDKTKMLLSFLQERDRSVYEKFKECLILSKQDALKDILEAEESKHSQGMKTEDNTGNECYWRVLLQWIYTAATSALVHFSRKFQMRFISGESGSIILKFVALKDFKVELLDQSHVQMHLEKLLRKGCLDSKIKVDGPVYVTVYILSPGDEGREEYIHFHLDFEAFHAQKESKDQLECHEIKLLVEELNPSQLYCWSLDQPQIGIDSKEKMDAVVSQRGLSRQEKMELILDIIVRLDNGRGTLQQFCEENDKYVYDKVFRKSKQMDPKTSLSYQKGGGRQKLYSMWINIDEGFAEEGLGTVKGFSEEDLRAFKEFNEEDLGAVKGFNEEVKGKALDVHVEEIMKKGNLSDDEERAWKGKNYEAENKYQESPGLKLDAHYHEARQLQELFHGRFSQEEAVRLYTFCNRNLQEAINFVFHGKPEDIRNVIGEGEWRIMAARQNRDINQILKNEIPDEVRQFGCETCDKVWWSRVPVRKLVSRCKSCKQKFDAIPREDEWGWAKYICNKCTTKFNGFGAMGRTMSPCYRCDNLCMPVEILPPYNKKPIRKSSNVHSCTAPNCYNRIPHASSDKNLCVHPKSMKKSFGRKVLNPSHQHISTGSTVKTFLNQDDLESQYEPTLYDISESDDNDDFQ